MNLQCGYDSARLLNIHVMFSLFLHENAIIGRCVLIEQSYIVYSKNL